MGGIELLLALAPGVPAALAVLWPLARLRRILAGLAPWAALPALALALVPGAEGTSLVMSTLFTGLHLEVQGPGRAFLLLTALLWVVAGAFARSYHLRDPRKESFFGFFSLTMAGNLGLVLAADILTFYLFFACMTFAAYGLVVHRRNGEARRAGRIYIAMAVLGELALLVGLFMLGWSFGGVPLFGEGLDRAWEGLADVGVAGAASLLLVAGFGVKAGLAPLHLWLPLAHPVAPTAASALLSGAMIKAGVLAWIRYLPTEIALPELGVILMILGVFSAFYGVVTGLAQDDPKTVLAYSSVSQMGYMALGVGLVVREPDAAAVAFLAVVLYAIHHGLAKGALFLAVGVADRIPRSPESRWPSLVLVVAALPALALSGAPLTTGAQVKGVLGQALPRLAPDWYPFLGPALMVAALGTTLLMARFLVTLATRVPKGEPGSGKPPWGLAAPWMFLVVLGVAGQLWLPLTFPAPAELELPGPLEGLVAAAGPVGVGAFLGWLVWRRPRFLRGLGSLRIPAGDLVIPIESFVRWAATRRGRRFLEQESGAGARLHRVQLWSHDRAAWVAERDLLLARGSMVGVLLIALILALFGVLRLW